MVTSWRARRREVLGAGAALGATFALPGRAPAQGGAKPFQGVTLNVANFSHTYTQILPKLLPEFEAQTGIKVVYDTPSFPVYNQRADLEFSTKGAAYDVANVTFIYSSRWIGAGWFTPLEPWLQDPSKTPADYEVADIIPGAIAPMRDKKGAIHAIPWVADAMIACAARFDIVQKAGFGMPATWDELRAMLQATHRKEGVAGYSTEANHNWAMMPIVHSLGGNLFRNPPEDLMPTIDSPEVVEAAGYYAGLLRDFGAEGILSFLVDQGVAALKSGRTNYMTHALAFLATVGDPASSKAAATAAYSMMPGGPKGRFPSVASHGWGLPAGSRNKDAGWAFITWATSKQMQRRLLVEHGYGGVTRRSAVEAPEFKSRMTINGYDCGRMFLDVLERAAATGHMAYRTVHVFPQVGLQVNKAVELIASGQMGAKEAMVQAQAQALADLRRAGVKL
jgi:multiple sugar transport system substrate-binding protein